MTTMTDLRDMNDSEKLQLVRELLEKPVETFRDAIIILDELDKVVQK